LKMRKMMRTQKTTRMPIRTMNKIPSVSTGLLNKNSSCTESGVVKLDSIPV